MKKKVLFTGGGGFVGSAMRHVELKDFHLEFATRTDLELTNQNAVDDFLLKKNYNILINSANVGGTRKDPLEDVEVLNQNLKAFLNLHKHRNEFATFIQLGSGAEYGRPLLHKNIKEEAFGKIIPSDSYGLSKYLASNLIIQDSSFNGVVLRIFGLFGPNEDYQVRFISNAIVRALCDYPIIIKQNIKFDYVDIDDFIRILQIFMQKKCSYRDYNIGTGYPLYLSEIAEIVRQLVNPNLEIIIEKKVVDYEYTCNAERLNLFLGNQFRFTSIENSIKKLIHYYEEKINTLNIDWILNPI